MHGIRTGCSLVLLVALLQGCTGGGQPSTGGQPSSDDGPPADAAAPPIPPDAIPRVEPRSRYGNPRSYVVFGRRYHVMNSAQGYVERGVASWYGRKFHGRRTSSGEPYDMHAMTAAHKSLPLPTYVQVTNLRNGRTVVLRVNDRGPFHDNRILDLSYAAARKLDILRDGTGLVEVRALTPDPAPAPSVIAVSAAAAALPTAAQPLSTTGTSAAPSPESVAPVLYLQIGAFSDRRNAERLMRRIASIEGARPHIQDLELNGQHIYRVKLGPMASVEEADRVSSSVVSAGMELPHIVIE